MPDYELKRPVINGRESSVWYVCWSENRRSCRRSTGSTDKVVAKRFLAQYQAAIEAPPETFTVADLCDAYLKGREEDPKVAYPQAIRNALGHIKRHFGDLPPSMISKATVRTYTAQRRRVGMKDSTISKELRFLRQALKYGVNEKWMPGPEPHVEIPGESVPRDRYLTREEFARLFFHASPFHLRVFLALAISTAARGKHILALTWDRVDFDRGFVRYRPGASANKKTAPIPMNSNLRPILEKAYEARGKSGRVIEWNGKRVLSVRRAYTRACTLAGLSDAHRHDLRRTAASWAAQDGVPIEEIAQMLGDSVEMTRKHYAQFSADYLRGAVDSIARSRA